LLIFSSLRNGAPQIRCVNVGKEIGGIKEKSIALQAVYLDNPF
jgi:hypothetical protein